MIKQNSMTIHLNHLSEFSNMTNDHIIKMASSTYGIDAEYALLLFLEREICKGAVNNIIEKLLLENEKSKNNRL